MGKGLLENSLSQSEGRRRWNRVSENPAYEIQTPGNHPKKKNINWIIFVEGRTRIPYKLIKKLRLSYS
jgi:hypothetical protein